MYDSFVRSGWNCIGRVDKTYLAYINLQIHKARILEF